MNGKNRTSEARQTQIVGCHRSYRMGPGARADQRYALWLKDGIQVSDTHGLLQKPALWRIAPSGCRVSHRFEGNDLERPLHVVMLAHRDIGILHQAMFIQLEKGLVIACVALVIVKIP